MRVPRTLLGAHRRGRARPERRDPAGRHAQPAGRPGDHGHQRRRGRRHRRAGSCSSGRSSSPTYVWLAFLGAGLATVLVYGVASLGREGATPVKLALARRGGHGRADVADDGDRHDQRRRARRAALLAGRVAGRPLHAGLLADGAVHPRRVVVALASGRALNGLALGEDVAVALGPARPADADRDVRDRRAALRRGDRGVRADRLRRPRRPAPRAAVLRAGLPLDPAVLPRCSTPIVLLLADIVGRLVVSPGELQVGVVLGVLGAPAFVFLVRYRNLVGAVIADQALTESARVLPAAAARRPLTARPAATRAARHSARGGLGLRAASCSR